MKHISTIGAAAAISAVMAAVSTPALAQQLGTAAQISQQTVQEAERSQQRVEQLDAEAQRLLNDYRANMKQLEQLNRYNASQQRQVAAQQRELESLRNDIANISSLQRSVQPLMEDMLDALGKVIAADVPFQPEERAERIARLERLMDDPDQSPAQRYRLIVEAYQIENEYGRTIEAYRGTVDIDGETYENAEFLRVGRLTLVMRTDDDQVLKIYNIAEKRWVDLDKSFLRPLRVAARMAKEQIPPDLITLPVPAPQRATAQ